ncbi:hypothetical protein JCM16303_006051 [Sporobolomyces ruberrimus]
MAVGISKTTTIPLLALTFIFSVVGLDESRGVIIQSVFACAWTTFFSLLFLITGFVLPRNSFFSAGVVGIVIFLSFLQLIVAAGSSVALYKTDGALYSRPVHRAWLGISFVAAFMALFTTIAAFLNYVAGKAVDVQPRKEEDPHF